MARNNQRSPGRHPLENSDRALNKYDGGNTSVKEYGVDSYFLQAVKQNRFSQVDGALVEVLRKEFELVADRHHSLRQHFEYQMTTVHNQLFKTGEALEDLHQRSTRLETGIELTQRKIDSTHVKLDQQIDTLGDRMKDDMDAKTSRMETSITDRMDRNQEETKGQLQTLLNCFKGDSTHDLTKYAGDSSSEKNIKSKASWTSQFCP